MHAHTYEHTHTHTHTQSPIQTNTFQCILVASNAALFVIFLYADGLIQWTTADSSGGSNGFGGTQAQIGFNAGNSVNYANVPGSRTPDIVNIASASNVLLPGRWIYAVREAGISSVGMDVIKQTIDNANNLHLLFNT